MSGNNSTQYNQRDARQQIKDFAHTLDASSYILRKLNIPIHKLRDVVDALQGAGGGRSEFDLSHLSLARRLRHTGIEKTAEAYARRKVAALDREQRKAGRMLFTIERGGGFEHKRTHYTDNLTPVANWMMQQARTSDLWAQNPGRAIEAFTDAALEMLPEATSEDEQERDSMPIEDDLYIQRMISQSINCALKACDRAAENGGDDVAVARMAAERLLRYAEDRHRARKPSDAGEGLQICKPSEADTPENPEEQPNMLLAALDYANYDDLPVFPVKPDKSPHTPNGFKDASADETIVRHLWRKYRDANIGIPTGEASGWLVLDIDPRHGGDVSLTALIDEYGELPATLEAHTGGGGHHIIFAYPKGSNIRNSAGKLGEGVDVRGEGGYIIVAPSIHASGKAYQWLNDHKPAPVPEWLLNLLSEEKPISTDLSPSKARSQAKSGAAIGAVVIEGERNETLFRIGCAMRGYESAGAAEIEAHLQEVNMQRCSPPLELAEVQKIAGSAARYPTNAAKATSAARA